MNLVSGVTGGPLAERIDANIVNLGGERHRRLRALAGPALTPRAADRWRRYSSAASMT